MPNCWKLRQHLCASHKPRLLGSLINVGSDSAEEGDIKSLLFAFINLAVLNSHRKCVNKVFICSKRDFLIHRAFIEATVKSRQAERREVG